MTVPEWVQDCVFYQIFPDRFANGDTTNDPPNIVPWNSKPTITSYHGGDIRGIIEKMYYLLDLGINAIYLNPIFLAASNHRYNTTDYFEIDPMLGTKTDFYTFLDVAHRNNMRVVIDGVFNHSGRGFFAFNDILENQEASPYTDWFHIKKFPVDAYSPGDATSYEGWWKFKSLPKFNTQNPLVRDYIFKVARYWTEKGIDGWRLDVPNEIDDDVFWYDFRKVVKKVNPEAYLIGEIWDGNPRWVDEEHFDGLMNYPMRTEIIDLLTQKIDAEKFAENTIAWYTKYPQENSMAMYSLLGSHDTERIFTILEQDNDKAKLAWLFLLSFPGAPAVYYGDEIGVTGGSDPECRTAFPWEESTWKADLRYWIKRFIWIRKEHISLRRGDFQILKVENPESSVAFIRFTEFETTIVLMNTSDKTEVINVTLPAKTKDGTQFYNLLNSEVYSSNQGKLKLSLSRWSGVLLIIK
jgi:cyclomaltodextrinase / maltogenic alpha-amylase / neopullulanase